MSAAFKKGDLVRYKTRARSGTGTIAQLRKTGRGIWYGVKTPQADILCVRAAGLKAA